MPRQQGVSVQNKFIRGLITESTALSFPEDACTETFNCVFDETGRITRRLGLDYEDGFVEVPVLETSGEAITEFLWQAVREQGSKTFLVQQKGNFLLFFETTDSINVSANGVPFFIDLDTFIAADSPRDPAFFQCQYASGVGSLLVVNPACDPIFLEFNTASGEVEATAIAVQQRDFDGVDDGLAQDERPTATFAGLGGTNPEHYYNILNQGWYIGDAITQWDAARTDMPSNQDYVALYRGSETDAFDNARVTANSTGSTPAAKGHFILTAWDLDRNAAMIAEGYTDANIGVTEVPIGSAAGVAFERHSTATFLELANGSTLAAVFDGDTTNAIGNNGDTINSGSLAGRLTWLWDSGQTFKNGGVGKNFSSLPVKIQRVVVYGGNDHGFSCAYSIGGNKFASNGQVTLTLRASNTAPTNSDFTSLGTVLGSVTFTDTNDESAGREIVSSDQSSFWNYVWVVVNVASFVENFGRGIGVIELELFTTVDTAEETYTIERPSCVEFFSGRAWYAGINTKGRGNKIYFSQIVESTDYFGRCYQKNDPTAEDFSDFLPTDGGVIRIPEMAFVKKLFAYQNSLLVFASNGVWQIQGSNNNAFIPTDFVVRRLSSVGTLSPMSFGSFKGVPVWWGEDGIYTVRFDANYGSFEVVNITDQTIATFIRSIPEYNRQFVKAAYDIRGTTMYFLYNDSADIVGDEYRYNGILASNGLTGAFYPWSFETGVDIPSLRGMVYVVDGSGVNDPVIKYVTTLSTNLTYSEVKSNTYTDWVASGDPQDYSSFFISGYKIDGQAQKFFQSNYAWVYLETDQDSSAFVQGLWDWSNSGSSGKWSTKQQVYNTSTTFRDVNHRRLKIRGKGKALQLRFTSEIGKPFTIIGWGLWETINAAV